MAANLGEDVVLGGLFGKGAGLRVGLTDAVGVEVGVAVGVGSQSVRVWRRCRSVANFGLDYAFTVRASPQVPIGIELDGNDLPMVSDELSRVYWSRLA